MPKILQVSTRHNVGGISKLIIELLGDSNFEQVYVTGRCENNEKEYSLQLTSPARNTYTFTQIHRLKRSIHFTDDVLALLALIKIIRKERPDIIHTHMSKAGLLGRIAAFLSFSHAKTVHSYHGHVLEGYFNKFFARIIIMLERILGKLTDAFVFDGQKTLLEINGYRIKPKKNQQVILPGLIKQISDENQYRVGDGKLRILVVARIEKVKRIDLILDVARNLAKIHPSLDYEIKVVGDGELRQSFENQSRNELLPVEFVGWKDDLSDYYKDADLLLSTSDSEGTPLSFMEAASFGCPIISTEVGSVADLIEDKRTGILCEKNAEVIATEIINLFGNQALLKTFSKNALAKASGEFTVDKFIDKHSKLYKSLLT
jgi:glycosyltransferase involved in cell wall biosynthesis